jgi:hypothetical protein
MVVNLSPYNALKSLNVNPTLSGVADVSLTHLIVDNGIVLCFNCSSHLDNTS